MRESELFGRLADKQHVCAGVFQNLCDQEAELAVSEYDGFFACFDLHLFKYLKGCCQRFTENGRLDG